MKTRGGINRMAIAPWLMGDIPHLIRRWHQRWRHMLSEAGKMAGMQGQALAQPTPTTEVAAFEELVHRYERLVLNYLWRMTGEEQSAYDLTQETFLRAWQHL